MIHSSHCEKTIVLCFKQRLIIIVLATQATKLETKRSSFAQLYQLANFQTNWTKDPQDIARDIALLLFIVLQDYVCDVIFNSKLGWKHTKWRRPPCWNFRLWNQGISPESFGTLSSVMAHYFFFDFHALSLALKFFLTWLSLHRASHKCVRIVHKTTNRYSVYSSMFSAMKMFFEVSISVLRKWIPLLRQFHKDNHTLHLTSWPLWIPVSP